ncbi:hypothetical protein ACLOJK_024003, partial [Asimina triloba]
MGPSSNTYEEEDELFYGPMSAGGQARTEEVRMEGTRPAAAKIDLRLAGHAMVKKSPISTKHLINTPGDCRA